MQFTALELSELIDGKLEGDPQVTVFRPAKIEDGTGGAVSFIANPKYLHFLYTTEASVLIVSNDLVVEEPVKSTLIRVKDPYNSFSKILDKFEENFSSKVGMEEGAFVHPTAHVESGVFIGTMSYVGENAHISSGVRIFPQVYLGSNVSVGKNSIIYPGVRIYKESKIGSRVIIHSGVVIGSDGFGFVPQEDGSYKKIAQLGNVVIEDDVEIGANTVIDRATVGSTLIRKGVKLDNLIQVAHNVEIGNNTVIAAQTGISGSTKLGEGCVVGGQVGFVGHLRIAAGTKINAQSGISKSITHQNGAWNGSPAFEYKDSLKSQVVFRQLPSLLKRIEELETRINKLRK